MSLKAPEAGTVDKATNSLPLPEKTGRLAQKLGDYAFRHREFFQGKSGHFIARNAAKVVVGVIPTATTFLLTRMGLQRADNFFAGKESLEKFRIFTDAKNHPVGWQTMFIIGGFSVFREFCRLWQRSYDRLFAEGNDLETMARVISNYPRQIVQDIKDITAKEWLATGISALPLSAVKLGFIDKEKFPVAKGRMDQAMNGLANDYVASALSYGAFFTLNDTLYDSLTEGKDSHRYSRLLSNHGPDPLGEFKQQVKGPLATFVKDNGVGRLVMNKVVPIAISTFPFIALQRMSRAQFGQPDLTQTGMGGFLNNLFREYAQFVSFATFTVTNAAYQDRYEWLLGKINDRQQKKQGTLI